MALLDQIRQKNPSLRDRSDDEIKSLIRTSPEFQYFSDDEFNAYVSGGEPAERSAGDETPGFAGGFSAGIDQLQAMGGGLIMAAGEAMESEGLLDTGRDIYARNMEEAGENDLGYGFTDIRSAGDAWNWARYTAGNLLPMMGASIAGGGIGGLAAGTGAKMVAGATARQAAIRSGQALGAGGASIGMESGAMMGETEDLDVSLAHGALAGALDALVPIKLLRSAGKSELADQAASEISDRVLVDLRRQAGRTTGQAARSGSLTGLMAEATTEGLQGLINQHASYWVENNGDTLLANLGEVDFKAIVDEAAAGGLMGGIVGGPAGIGERGQARTQVERIEQAREHAAAQGGDALSQALAAQEVEQETQPTVAPRDPAVSAEVGNRIQLAMGELDDLQALSRGSSYQGQTRLRNISTILERAERAYEDGNVEQARRLTERAEGIASNLRSALQLAGTHERPMEGVLFDPEAPQQPAGLLGQDSRRLPPGDPSTIYAEGPTADRTQYDPQARTVRRDEAMAAQREGAERMRETVTGRRAQLTDQGFIYGQGPVAGNANTGLDQPFAGPRFRQAPPTEMSGEALSSPAEEVSARTLQYRASGQQFATEGGAMASGIARQAQRAGRLVAAEPVEGGFALRIDDTADAQQTADAAPVAQTLRGQSIDDEWSTFSPDSGSLDIPRSEMPQIKAEHRGALANFLSARDIKSTEETVPASSLKPTQREFSEQRVQDAKERNAGDRAILVSADGHVVDGHHQWLAKADQGEDVRVIRLDAPIEEVLEVAREFPSSESDGAAATTSSDADQDSRPARQADARSELEQVQGREQETAQNDADSPVTEQETAQTRGERPDRQEAIQALRDQGYSLSLDRPEVTAPAPLAEGIAAALKGIDELSDTRVIQSARELPHTALLGMALRGVNPADVRGMYIGGDLYVIADNVESVQEGIRTAVHEAVGHKGIRGVLGSELDSVMLNLYRTLPNSKEGRAALREVRRDYPFLDPSKREDRITIGEEMVAHLLEKGYRPRAWQRAVARIRELLRRLFPSIAWTYTDALALGEKSREWLRRRQAAQSDSVVTRYSQRQGENKLFTPIQQEAEAYRKALDKALTSLKSRVGPINLGRTPPILARLGAPDLPITIMRDVVRKATNGVKHNVEMETIAQLPELLHDPVAVFRSRTEDNALAVMVDAVDRQGKPVMVALHLSRREGRLEVNRIASAYGDVSGGKKFAGMARDGLLRYLNQKKNPDLVRLIGVQFPGSGSPNQGLDSSVLTPEDVGNSDTLFSLAGKARAAFETQFDDFTDADRAAAAKIGSRTPPQRAMAWFKEHADRAGLKIRQGMVDRVAALKEIDEKLYGESALGENITRSSWVLARMSNAANGALHALLHNGRIRLDPDQKVITLQDGDAKGLGEVLGRLGSAAEIERFMGWIAGNRAAKLAEQGRENLFDIADIEAMKNWNRGTMDDGSSRQQRYQEVFKEFQAYRYDVLSIAEQSGIISSEQREMWREEPYVPFYRLAEEGGQVSGMMATSGLSRQQAYKRLKGGSQNLNDLLQNTLMNFHHLLDASLKNQAAVQAVKNARQLGMVERVSENNRDTKKSTFVMEGGQKVFYEIDDPLVFQALTALASPGMNSTAMKVMRAFKRVFTNLTTTTPQFMVANLIRDSLQATATNNVSKNAFKNVIDGAGAYRDQRIRAQMLASGASFNFGHLYGNNPDELRAQLTRNMRNANIVAGPAGVPNVLRAGWTWWNEVNNATENLNRAAIYSQNREGGELRAAFEARDLIDFSAHGAWPAVRVLIDIVPFLNARIQGLDKIYRSGVKPGASVLAEAFGKGKAGVTDKQAAARFWTVTGALAMATVALYLHNQDDEEYQKLEDWQRDTYWFFRAGDQAFFIPKPFEVGAIATLAERITEQFADDRATGEVFRQRLMHMMTDTFSFSPVPQMMQPALDIYANYDAFTGRPIEGMGMERLSPELRRRANTTGLAQLASTILNSTVGAIGDPDKNPLALSPVQVDHLIGGYLGQVGAWGAASMDVAWNAATGQEDPARRWYEYQPVRRFYRNLGDEDRYTKYGTVFYEGLREAGRAYSDVQELREMGRLADAAERAESNRELLALRKPLNRAQTRLRRINQQIDVIRRSSLDGEIKRQRIDRLSAVKNQIQRAVGERILEARAG